MEELCSRFIDLIERGAYYEAHEALEEAWFPRRFEASDEVRLIKGFINASVAFELVKRGRMKPAGQVWKVYLKYRPLLERVESSHAGSYRNVAQTLEERYERLFGS
ncbi:DUF309 domain-containing protein [Hydrogenimonas sp. SS33]|uniref:DUF309 domain-containing protein n=1 Tax=Hydrogenimonas leucolamina TaxID=2954236 RepID=UPI00336BE18A